MDFKFPGESTEYRAARARLLQIEIDARRAIEKAAQARRELPPGGEVPQDYVFETVDVKGVKIKKKLSELFEGKPSLAIYSFMYDKSPCRMCTPMLDCLNGAQEHVRQRLGFAVVAQAPIETLIEFKKQRGWKLPLLSTAGNDYNRDYYGKTKTGESTTMMNVFHRDGEKIRHFWGTELAYGPSDPGQDHRGLDMTNPIFAMFDMTPEGRGNWYTNLSY